MKCMKITHQGDTSSLHLGICWGQPTFKYTRIDVRHALGYLAAGRTIEQVAQAYEISVAAVQEALEFTCRGIRAAWRKTTSPVMIILMNNYRGLDRGSYYWMVSRRCDDHQAVEAWTVIKDDVILIFLRRVKQPAFVTLNYVDFWRRVPARQVLLCHWYKVAYRIG